MPLSTPRRQLSILIIGGILFGIAMLFAAWALVRASETATEQRHALCVQIQAVKRSERQLWARAIRRSVGRKVTVKQQAQIDGFKSDLAELFPNHPCH